VYFVYSLLLGTAMVVAIPWWLVQMARHTKYRAGLAQRFGILPRHLKNIHQPVLWIHAVSVGEVLAISTLVKRLQERHPAHRILISTTTATGNELARNRFGAENVFYFPLDFGFAIRPYLRALRPEMVILAETEFWPNFLRLASKARAKIAVVNARISDRSFPRYRRWNRVFRQVLQPVGIFIAQSEEDARRLIAVGASPERVSMGGNLKFEVAAPANAEIVKQVGGALAEGGTHPVIVAGSTVEDEEATVLEGFEQVRARYPQTGMILAPRHRERFEQVAKLVGSSNLRLVRRSQWNGEGLIPGTVFLLDSIGELASLYAVGDVVFVGGSLVQRGGHNILEPAQHGVPIVIGPHYENFRDIITIFSRADAVRIVAPEVLGAEFLRILDDPSGKTLGERAAAVIETQAGATDRTLLGVEAYMAGSQ
jgi:3-deoxy-D-manno-octulosonic-acid transferase